MKTKAIVYPATRLRADMEAVMVIKAGINYVVLLFPFVFLPMSHFYLRCISGFVISPALLPSSPSPNCCILGALAPTCTPVFDPPLWMCFFSHQIQADQLQTTNCKRILRRISRTLCIKDVKKLQTVSLVPAAHLLHRFGFVHALHLCYISDRTCTIHSPQKKSSFKYCDKSELSVAESAFVNSKSIVL